MEEHSYGGRRRRFRSNNICCVPQCYNRAGGDVSLHKFPTHPMLKKQWAHLFGIGRKLPQRAVACSEHFTLDCFTRKDEQTIRRRLFHNALPSLKLPVRLVDKDKIRRRQERALKQREMFARMTSEIEKPVVPENTVGTSNDQPNDDPSLDVCEVVIGGEASTTGTSLDAKIVSSPAGDPSTSSALSGKEMEAALTLLGLNMSQASDEDGQRKKHYDNVQPSLNVPDQPLNKDEEIEKMEETLEHPEHSSSSNTEKGRSDVPEGTVGTSSDSQNKPSSMDICKIVVRDEPTVRRRVHHKMRPNLKTPYRSYEKDDLNRRQERALKHLELYARLTSEIESSIGREDTVGTSNDPQFEEPSLDVCEVVIGDEPNIRRSLFHNALPTLKLPVRPLDKDEIKRRQERALRHLEHYARLTSEVENSCTSLRRGKRHNYQSARQR